jgi:multidrug efflux system outer membrane protein
MGFDDKIATAENAAQGSGLEPARRGIWRNVNTAVALSAVVLILTLSFLALLLLSGCAVGPDYHRPGALGTNALPLGFSDPGLTNTAIWHPAEPAAHVPRGRWWEVFGYPELNRLEELAATNNQQLAASLAALDQARALVRVARADFFPQVSTAPYAQRQRLSSNQSPSSTATSRGVTYNTFSVPLEAGWELDLWGRVRRSVESAQASFTASADDLEAARLSIQAEVAIDYITLGALDEQNQVLVEATDAYRRSLELTQNRRKSGIATELDVSQAETQLAGAEAQIPAVQLQRAQILHALAVLCGQPAMTFAVNTTTNMVNPAPPIPLGLPSQLLERRPDIASAERQMAAANAQVGVATAAFFPRVMINGAAGYQSIDASTLFDWPSRVWALGPSITWPLFTGGRTRAQLAYARSGYQVTVANYRQTVLSAFQDVEDQLAAQRLLSQQLEKETAAYTSAKRSVDISLTKYRGGVITYLDVVIAQSSELAHEQSMVLLRGQRLAATVSLIKALGAGWSAAETADGAKSKPEAAPAK